MDIFFSSTNLKTYSGGCIFSVGFRAGEQSEVRTERRAGTNFCAKEGSGFCTSSDRKEIFRFSSATTENWVDRLFNPPRMTEPSSGMHARAFSYSAIHPLRRNVLLRLSLKVARVCFGSR